MPLLFWISVFLILYPYLFYPLAIALIGAIRPRPVLAAEILPSVSILIPAYNEAQCIAATVENKLALDYPRELLQILVASDGSDDGTDDIVGQYRARGVELLRCEPRGGKALALNQAVARARGEIVVFSDANSLFEKQALRRMVRNFADPAVGYVTGSLNLTTQNATVSQSGGSAYLRYEEMVRRLETRVGSIIGVNGGVDAIRRALYSDIPKELITDFVLPLRVIAGGHRVIFDEHVVSHETPNAAVQSEYRMRVRVALRALQGLMHMRRLLNPFRFPLTAFCLGSHKVLRYLGFVFMVIALVANAVAAQDSELYRALLACHLGIYILAILGLMRLMPRQLGPLGTVPAYFLLSYVAFGAAFFKFFRGQSMATWKPRS